MDDTVPTPEELPEFAAPTVPIIPVPPVDDDDEVPDNVIPLFGRITGPQAPSFDDEE
jgi:hypothetical protein